MLRRAGSVPPAVVAVVEYSIAQLPNPRAEVWAHLLFYGLLGPAVTFFSVGAEEVLGAYPELIRAAFKALPCVSRVVVAARRAQA